MADNYVQFSVMIPTRNQWEQQFVLDFLQNRNDKSCTGFEPDETVAFTPEHNEIWVYSEDYGSLEVQGYHKLVADTVCAWQEKFEIKEPWSCESAFTCSKPMLDEFGSVAVVCYLGKQYWMSTGEWVIRKIKELGDEG